MGKMTVIREGAGIINQTEEDKESLEGEMPGTLIGDILEMWGILR